MTWWVPMVTTAIGVAGNIVQSNSQSAQNSNSQAWSQYNAQMQYNTDVGNIQAQSAIAGMNAAMTMQAGQMNAAMEFQAGILNAEQARRIAAYNQEVITATSLYNDTLYEQELGMLWEAMDLDLMLMANQRAVEQGAIEAQQSASGTVMGQDSNADVIIDQQTQAALDETVVRHNADLQAKKIGDARARSMWEAQNELVNTAWMGEMEAYSTMANATIRSMGISSNAAVSSMSTLLTSAIQEDASMYSANQALQSGMWGASVDYNRNQNTINNNFVNGMFSAASSGVQSYYQQKPTIMNNYSSPTTGGGGGGGAGSSLAVGGSSYTFGTGYSGSYTL